MAWTQLVLRKLSTTFVQKQTPSFFNRFRTSLCFLNFMLGKIYEIGKHKRKSLEILLRTLHEKFIRADCVPILIWAKYHKNYFQLIRLHSILERNSSPVKISPRLHEQCSFFCFSFFPWRKLEISEVWITDFHFPHQVFSSVCVTGVVSHVVYIYLIKSQEAERHMVEMIF